MNNDELRAQLAEANKDCDDLRALAERLLAKLSEGKVTIADLRAQVTALEQERNSWPVLRLEGAEARVMILQQQLAAMTEERDGLLRRIEEEEPIFHDMLKQLAESHKDCDDLRALAERLMAKLSEGKVMMDDIKIMGEL